MPQKHSKCLLYSLLILTLICLMSTIAQITYMSILNYIGLNNIFTGSSSPVVSLCSTYQTNKYSTMNDMIITLSFVGVCMTALILLALFVTILVKAVQYCRKVNQNQSKNVSQKDQQFNLQGQFIQGQFIQGQFIQGQLIQGQLIQGQLIQGQLIRNNQIQNQNQISSQKKNQNIFLIDPITKQNDQFLHQNQHNEENTVFEIFDKKTLVCFYILYSFALLSLSVNLGYFLSIIFEKGACLASYDLEWLIFAGLAGLAEILMIICWILVLHTLTQHKLNQNGSQIDSELHFLLAGKQPPGLSINNANTNNNQENIKINENQITQEIEMVNFQMYQNKKKSKKQRLLNKSQSYSIYDEVQKPKQKEITFQEYKKIMKKQQELEEQLQNQQKKLQQHEIQLQKKILNQAEPQEKPEKQEQKGPHENSNSSPLNDKNNKLTKEQEDAINKAKFLSFVKNNKAQQAEIKQEIQNKMQQIQIEQKQKDDESDESSSDYNYLSQLKQKQYPKLIKLQKKPIRVPRYDEEHDEFHRQDSPYFNSDKIQDPMEEFNSSRYHATSRHRRDFGVLHQPFNEGNSMQKSRNSMSQYLKAINKPLAIDAVPELHFHKKKIDKKYSPTRRRLFEQEEAHYLEENSHSSVLNGLVDGIMPRERYHHEPHYQSKLKKIRNDPFEKRERKAKKNELLIDFIRSKYID